MKTRKDATLEFQQYIICIDLYVISIINIMGICFLQIGCWTETGKQCKTGGNIKIMHQFTIKENYFLV